MAASVFHTVYTRVYSSHSPAISQPPPSTRQWKHLADIAGHTSNRPDIDIGMLVGRNVPAAFQPISVISGGPEEPWAEQYKFGWTIIGRVCKDNNSEQNTAYVNRGDSRERSTARARDLQPMCAQFQRQTSTRHQSLRKSGINKRHDES